MLLCRSALTENQGFVLFQKNVKRVLKKYDMRPQKVCRLKVDCSELSDLLEA